MLYNLRTLLFLMGVFSLTKHSHSQNVGIGTSSPTGKLQVNHRSNVPTPGLLMLDSTGSRSGNIRFRNINATKYIEIWGFSGNNFSSADQYLDIESDSAVIATFRGNGRVGINNIAPAERLDVNGNINLTGVLKVNGSAGSAGQVLTSNGTADPQWKNGAYSPNIRFGVEYSGSGTLQIISTYYNSNPAEIVIGFDFVAINRPGLYRFQGNYNPWVQGSIVNLPESNASLNFSGGVAFGYSLSRRRAMPQWQGGGGNYEFTDHFSLEVYIPAPTFLRLNGTFNNDAGASFKGVIAKLFCHLISE